MKVGRIQCFNFWIGLVLVYLFIKMEDMLGVAIINSTSQLVMLYIIYGLGFFILFTYGKFVVNHFILTSLLFVVFGVISTALFGMSSADLLHDIIYMSFWFLTMMICYSFSDVLRSSKFIVKLMIIFDFIMIISFYMWFLNGGRSSLAAVNAVYFITCLFPLVFLDINKYAKAFIFVATTACTLLSGKRTALIVIVIAFCVPYIINLFMLNRKHKFKIAMSLVTIAGTIVLLYGFLLDKFNIIVFERFQNISTDGGSGRLDIYRTVIDSFGNSNIFHKLLGHGYNGVFSYGVTYTSAHNDFLEILFDNGLVGVFLYLIFVIGMISIGIKLLRLKKVSALSMVSALLVFLCMSLTSHLIIYPTYFIYLVIIIMIGRADLYGRDSNESATH